MARQLVDERSIQAESHLTHRNDKPILSRDLMDYTIAHARSAIAVLDRDLTYRYVSRGYLKKYKVKDKNIIGKSHYDIFPNLSQKWKDILQRSLSGEVLSQEEESYFKEDGSISWLRWEYRPWYESNGSIGGIIIYNEIINEHKTIEETSRESGKIVKFSANALKKKKSKNPDGSEIKVHKAEPPRIKTFGFSSREEFRKHRVTDLYKNPYDIFRYNKKLLKDAALKKDQLPFQGNNSTSFPGSAAAGVKNDVTYYDALLDDITRSNQKDVSIRHDEEKYHTMLGANPDPVVVYDIAGRIVYFNPAFTRLFGWSLGERRGEKNDTFVPEEAWSETNLMIDKVLAGEEFHNFETCRRNKKGEIIPVSISGTICKDQNGHPIGSIINLRDISYQQKIKARLEKFEKNEAIGTLAGGIAHDFNNILFPILGYTEMLLEDIPENSPYQKNLNNIYNSAIRAKELVNQILTFSREEKNELKRIKIQPIIKETLTFIRSTIPTTIEIQQDINPDGGVIKSDSTQIHRIVMNLSTNAYHAMEETGGKLKVSLKEIKLRKQDLITPDMIPGVYACLTVADTGVGMDKALLEKIFDPFFTTKAIGKGTGLGLSAVHGIVTSMNGAIQVHSEPGKGTQFYVYLPVEKTLSKKEQKTGLKTQIQGGAEQILLVDDEADILTMEQQMLERLGYHVFSCSGSIEALEVFRDSPDKFDLVITDMTMPDMTGDKLSVELIKIRPDIPILICTGFNKLLSEEKIKTLGIHGLLFKPIIMKVLAQKIRTVLEKNKNCSSHC